MTLDEAVAYALGSVRATADEHGTPVGLGRAFG